MPARSVLLVAHISPPSTMSAARRVAGLAEHLGALGHEVTVLTSRLAGDGPVAGARATIRTPDLMATRLNWRRANFEAISGEGGGQYAARPSRVAELIVPDVQAVSWLPFALRAARRLARSQAIDCVITTSPSASAHLVGLALRRRGVPWIADFRDGWTFDRSALEFPTRVQRRLDRALERRVAGSADLVVGVTEPITADLAQRLGARALTITNGFDPAELAPDPPAPATRNGESFRLVYTGSLAFGDRSPRPLLDAIGLLRERAPDLAGRLELVIAGPVAGADREALQAGDVAFSAVRLLGSVSREQVLALQREADALLLLTGDHPSVATGKLYEYLAARRPILVLGDHSAAARIVEQAQAGIAVPHADREQIAAGLEAVMDGAGAVTGASREAALRYSYAAIAARYAEAIEAAIASRSGAPDH